MCNAEDSDGFLKKVRNESPTPVWGPSVGMHMHLQSFVYGVIVLYASSLPFFVPSSLPSSYVRMISLMCFAEHFRAELRSGIAGAHDHSAAGSKSNSRSACSSLSARFLGQLPTQRQYLHIDQQILALPPCHLAILGPHYPGPVATGRIFLSQATHVNIVAVFQCQCLACGLQLLYY